MPGTVLSRFASTERPTYLTVFAVSEFRSLWVAQVLSVVGDQLARVALTLLVFDRTGSPFWAAVTYAVTLVPWLLGGVILTGLADRLPRRRVMVACDLLRMCLVCVMALLSAHAAAESGLLLLVALLFVVTMLDSPFKAARSATVPDILDGDSYVLGVAISQMALQTGMVVGFALGGVVVTALHVDGALVADAATFAGSALLIRFGVRPRPAAAGRGPDGTSGLADIRAGVRLVFGSAPLRTLVLFGWLVAFYVVPMGLAGPYADSMRTSLPLADTTGLIFAAGPFGAMAGGLAFGRFVPADRREAWMRPLAVAACGVLVLTALHPGLPASLAILALSGACSSYQLAANAAFVTEVPRERRGQAFGLANGGMQIFQGLWIVLAGVATGHEMGLDPAVVIAISGAAGAALASILSLSGHWSTPVMTAARQRR